MNINNLLDAGANVSISITPADLKEFALLIIAQAREEQQLGQQPEKFMTPTEVAGAFGVTKNTLWRWDRLGYLKPVRCGRRLHYKRSEVMALLNGNNSTGKGGAA